MPSLPNHEHRITALEDRVSEVESCHGEAIYKLHRDNIETRIGIHVLLDHFGLPRVTPEQVDDVLDQE